MGLPLELNFKSRRTLPLTTIGSSSFIQNEEKLNDILAAIDGININNSYDHEYFQ